MFGLIKNRSISSSSTKSCSMTPTSASSSSSSSFSFYGGRRSCNIDYNELVALYDITKADVQRFGTRKFRALCVREGPDVAARHVEQALQPQRSGKDYNHEDYGGDAILEEADIWMNADSVEVVLGATF